MLNDFKQKLLVSQTLCLLFQFVAATTSCFILICIFQYASIHIDTLSSNRLLEIVIQYLFWL